MKTLIQAHILQSDPSWQAVLRALCALEAVIQHGSSVPCGEVAIHFQVRPLLSERFILSLTCSTSYVFPMSPTRTH